MKPQMSFIFSHKVYTKCKCIELMEVNLIFVKSVLKHKCMKNQRYVVLVRLTIF